MVESEAFCCLVSPSQDAALKQWGDSSVLSSGLLCPVQKLWGVGIEASSLHPWAGAHGPAEENEPSTLVRGGESREEAGVREVGVQRVG